MSAEGLPPETILGLALSGDVSPPSAEDLARLLARVEVVWDHGYVLAAVLHLAIQHDQDMRAQLTELAEIAVAAGCHRPGGVLEGIRLRRECERLLAGGHIDPNQPAESLVGLCRYLEKKGTADPAKITRVVGELEEMVESPRAG